VPLVLFSSIEHPSGRHLASTPQNDGETDTSGLVPLNLQLISKYFNYLITHNKKLCQEVRRTVTGCPSHFCIELGLAGMAGLAPLTSTHCFIGLSGGRVMTTRDVHNCQFKVLMGSMAEKNLGPSYRTLQSSQAHCRGQQKTLLWKDRDSSDRVCELLLGGGSGKQEVKNRAGMRRKRAA